MFQRIIDMIWIALSGALKITGSSFITVDTLCLAQKTKGFLKGSISMAFVCLNLIMPINGFATDEGGCLVCHQYPGIVKLTQSGQFKVLHIDEQLQLESDHGEVGCRQCHNKINQTPHTDMTEVDCTTDCHLEDREKIVAMTSSLSAFHRDEKTAITKIEHKSSCAVCHPVYPHGKNNKVRAIFNLHSAHLQCEVCHLKLDEYAQTTFSWGVAEKVNFLAKPFANYAVEETQGADTYTLSRIAVYANGDQMVLNSEDIAAAVSFKATSEEMTTAQKQNKLDFFHREIVRKEITVACNECHRENGRLNYKNLGFDEQRINILEHLNIKGWATKYDTFYFPKLF